ncbi:MAG: hypothetical protein LUD68_11235 [Rikenellaceae bacterium]|nr:hypothetical protein [Rikenellaceae bacterium]
MKFSFFNTRKPRQFDYRPRYYDPAQEEREARKRELLGEDYQPAEGEQAYKPGQYIRQMRIRRGIIADREKKQRQQRRTLRSIILLALLCAFAWWLMTADFSNSIWAVFFSGVQ